MRRAPRAKSPESGINSKHHNGELKQAGCALVSELCAAVCRCSEQEARPMPPWLRQLSGMMQHGSCGRAMEHGKAHLVLGVGAPCRPSWPWRGSGRVAAGGVRHQPLLRRVCAPPTPSSFSLAETFILEPECHLFCKSCLPLTPNSAYHSARPFLQARPDQQVTHTGLELQQHAQQRRRS